MVLGLQRFEGIIDDEGRPVFDAEAGEELMRVEPGVAVALSRRPPEPHGTLYISTRRVIWLSDAEKGKGYAVDFLAISLHAVSRDPEAYPLSCIYTQIDTEECEEMESEDSDSDANGHVELSTVSEMRLVPSDSSQLDSLFEVFCQCAELNPDPHEEEQEENSWIFSAEDMADDGSDSEVSENMANPIGSANGHHDLARTVHELQINDQRFEDAEEAEHESHDNRRLAH